MSHQPKTEEISLKFNPMKELNPLKSTLRKEPTHERNITKQGAIS